MNQLTRFTWRQLSEEIERFHKADMLDMDSEVKLRVGNGTLDKHMIGYSLTNNGLVLTISGNEASVTPRRRKSKAVQGKVQDPLAA